VSELRPRSVVPACLFAWLLPGAGHAYLGRTGRGLVLFGSIMTLFVLGLAMDSRLQFYAGLDDPLAILRSIAQMATGLPYLVARSLGFEAGRPEAVFHEYGNTFTEVAGLLNVLVTFDAHDIATGRRP
jgi:hypothetical protein